MMVEEGRFSTRLNVSLILAVTPASHADLFQILRMSSWNLILTCTHKIDLKLINKNHDCDTDHCSAHLLPHHELFSQHCQHQVLPAPGGQT